MESLLTELQHLPGSLIYAFVGVLIFGLTFWIINKVVPFSIRKEIEEDQNTALGVIIGCTFLGLSIIIAAAIT